MKKVLLVILIILIYSCCTNKNTPKVVPKGEEYPAYRFEKGEKNESEKEKSNMNQGKKIEISGKKEKSNMNQEVTVMKPNPLYKAKPKIDTYPDTTPPQDAPIIVRKTLHNNSNQSSHLALISSNTITPVFDRGNINYVIQDTMIVGVINEVNVTISKGVDIKDIIKDVKTFTESNIHTDTIRIAPVMRARLIDPSNGINFIISPKTSTEQFLEIGDYTRWTWDVTPINKGNNKLSLAVDVMYGDKSKSYQIYDGIIYVYSNETFFQKITKFLVKNLQYILSSLIIPFGVFLYTRYKKKKN